MLRVRDESERAHAVLLDATDSWLRRAMTAIAHQTGAGASHLTCAVRAVKELVRPAPEDRGDDDSPPGGPIEEAAATLGRPLGHEEVAVVVLALLDARPHCRRRVRLPLPRLATGLVPLLRRFPRASPWDLGLAYVMGWRREVDDPRRLAETFPLAVGAAEQLVLESVVRMNRLTVRFHMLCSARLECPGSVATVARWVVERLTCRDCACGHHSRHLGCRGGAGGVGSRCRRLCCRHTWSAFNPPERLGQFTARMVGGDTLLLKRGPLKDFGDSLFVQAVTDPELGDALLWMLPNTEVTTLEVCLGDVQFNVCHSCEKRYEGSRCPQCSTPFDARRTERLVRPRWLFAKKIEGLFEYEIGWVSECACGASFAPEQLGRACPHCRRSYEPRRGSGMHIGAEGWRQVWVKRLTGRIGPEGLT